MLDSSSAVSLLDEGVFKLLNMKLEPTDIKLNSASVQPLNHMVCVADSERLDDLVQHVITAGSYLVK